MKHTIIFCLVLFILVSSPLFAAGIREERAREEALAHTPTLSGSSVWKISGDSGIMFMAGSVHILRETDFPLPGEFDLAFNKSDRLVLEADVTLMEDPLLMEYLVSQMFLPDDLTLKDVLDPEVFELLAEVCYEFGFSINDVMRFKPSMVMMILSLLQIEDFGFVQYGVDHYYQEKAYLTGMPVYFLETVESQIHAIVSMGVGYENEFILYSIQDMAGTEDGLELLMEEWKYGKSEGMEETLRAMREDWPSIYRALITARHDAWQPQLIDMIASEYVYFVITGVLHKHGPNGLIQMLEDLGYTVEQLTTGN
ncbi:MAG: TraB/GumN family protein [Treponema sp.]|nr:TraB/GumN family protein [Treponema sp.]